MVMRSAVGEGNKDGFWKLFTVCMVLGYVVGLGFHGRPTGALLQEEMVHQCLLYMVPCSSLPGVWLTQELGDRGGGVLQLVLLMPGILYPSCFLYPCLVKELPLRPHRCYAVHRL